jgi:membrane-associated phospholipid phosphatase
MYLYVHYPTDVIFSIFAGILFAVIGNLIAKKIPLGKLGRKGKFEK